MLLWCGLVLPPVVTRPIAALPSHPRNSARHLTQQRENYNLMPEQSSSFSVPDIFLVNLPLGIFSSHYETDFTLG